MKILAPGVTRRIKACIGGLHIVVIEDNKETRCKHVEICGPSRIVDATIHGKGLDVYLETDSELQIEE